MTETGTSGLESSRNLEHERARATVEIVKDYTEVQGDGDPVLLVNVAAGNEPRILGVKVAQEANRIREEHGLAKAKIIVPVREPEYEQQQRILLEESPTDPELIYLDTQYGEILQQVTSSQGNFAEHLSVLKNYYDDTERAINERFSKDFETRSLTTGEIAENSPSNIIGTIDVGSRLIVNAPRRYFMFPVVLSELIAAAQQEGLSFSESDMKAVAHRMRSIEQQYTQVFIPKVNTLSYQYLSGDPGKTMEQMYDEELSAQPVLVNGRSRLYTPAMKPEMPVEYHPEVQKKGVYAMFSGTGSATEQTRDLIAAAQEAGLTVFTVPWAEDVEGVYKVSPAVLSDPKIMGIFGRSGWGTGWRAQNLAKPWFVTPYEKGDDPEIHFNNLLVQRLRMGKVVDPSRLSAEQLASDIAGLSPGLQVLHTKINEEFGTNDGIRYIAEAVAKDYLGKS